MEAFGCGARPERPAAESPVAQTSSRDGRSMSTVALLGIDWGSTSVRAFAITSDGDIVAVRRAEDGVLSATGDFALRLRRLLGDWLDLWPEAPIVLCGMIGSDRGWVHAPYVTAPCGVDTIAAGLATAPFDRSEHSVPGVSV